MAEDRCPESPDHRHCWHKDPKPDYSRPAPYRVYCCWCGNQYFEKGFSGEKPPAHGRCRDGNCRVEDEG